MGLLLFGLIFMCVRITVVQSKASERKCNQGAKQYSQPPGMAIDPNKKYTAVFHTDKGDFTVELFAKEAPVTVNNFVFLARVP